MKPFFYILRAFLSIFSLLILIYFSVKKHGILIFSSIKANSNYNREALYWTRVDSGVKCNLCPNNCFLPEGIKGKCHVRINKDNTLYTQVYNQVVSLNVDPIEKKPVFHMLPGSKILSLATIGCPLKCSFCQNWSISQIYPEEIKDIELITPEQIVNLALKYNIPSIAYTYSEPVIFYEYMFDIAKLAHKYGIKNVMVTSGYFNPEPLKNILPYFDVIKVDLKAFNNRFYSKLVKGYLSSILTNLRIIKENNVFMEIVNLIVPEQNDNPADIKKMCIWIKENLGNDVPLFFTRFYPAYKLKNLPPTPYSTLVDFYNIAKKEGINYVYVGNAPELKLENTYCPNCGVLLIERYGYLVIQNNINNNKCYKCGKIIPGIWK